MNIFNRNKHLDDDLPGAREMPRVPLPKIEDQISTYARDQVAQRPKEKTIAQLVIDLDVDAHAFEAAVADAEEAAKNYCQTYAELEAMVSATLEANEAQRKQLQRLRASLPKVEKSDEKPAAHTDISDPYNHAGTGQVESRSRPQLSIADRRPKPIQT